MRTIYWGEAPILQTAEGGNEGMVQRDGELYYRISNYQNMSPFLMTLVSGTEHWMYLSSNGGLTCGRRNPDNALFPYYTDDKIHDACTTTGSKTIFLVERENKSKLHLWKPFVEGQSAYALERHLYKNLAGTRLIYEEVNHDLELVFSYAWSTSDRYGFIKESCLRNTAEQACRIELLDGLRNVLPYGVTLQTQNQLSTLLDAYKQAEKAPQADAGIYSLSSILTDRAEPCEALKATVVWCRGLADPKILLSEDQVGDFGSGAAVEAEPLARGKRGAFFVNASLSLNAGESHCWQLVADVEQGPSQLHALINDIREGISLEELQADIDAGKQRLMRLVGGADGFQCSADALTTARHFSNTLFNIMRGGTFYEGYSFSAEDLLDFVETWNAPLRKRYASLLDSVEGPLHLGSLLTAAENKGDADLRRLSLEYLPLTFSRRHGDPSRPWNQFSIDIKNDDGSDKLFYQGNWRDIFQNWEALSLSYPEYIESVIAKFVNASTAGGYNPYRITRDGIDWEVPEPDNPWSNIGYWGDHQINYLLKLIELSCKYHPGKIGRWLGEEIFVYANVPYRIKGYRSLVADPHNTVIFDHDREAVIAERVAAMGSDGKLLYLVNGSVCRANLLEKLLVPVLAKLASFVPGGGIWMNTQRPEWNDANNALVGYGLSMVTLCYLRRFVSVFADLLQREQTDEFAVTEEVAVFIHAIKQTLQEHESQLDQGFDAARRKQFMDELGIVAEAYREQIYSGFSGDKVQLGRTELIQFLQRAERYCDQSISSSQRADGLFHSYNLIEFGPDGYEVEPLIEMLEGQVAVLSSGWLNSKESLELLEQLSKSRMYRSDQNSYLLYPDRPQKKFLQQNIIDPALVQGNKLIQQDLASGQGDLVERDALGNIHFNPRFRNAAELVSALVTEHNLAVGEVNALCDVYEAVFRHRQFTGRSGSMFKYEGLGSIYWHMVSKLLLATAEVIEVAARTGVDEEVLDQLLLRFDDIKNGIGVHKSPRQYGAFPIDPYSHTPGFTGVQQPGMTGQVKEDFISRFAELGVIVEGGRIQFAPSILCLDEFSSSAATWCFSLGGNDVSEELPEGSIAFTLCAVPVVYRLAESYAIQLEMQGGRIEALSGNELDESLSQSIFRRDGRIRKLFVDIPRDELRTKPARAPGHDAL